FLQSHLLATHCPVCSAAPSQAAEASRMTRLAQLQADMSFQNEADISQERYFPRYKYGLRISCPKRTTPRQPFEELRRELAQGDFNVTFLGRSEQGSLQQSGSITPHSGS